MGRLKLSFLRATSPGKVSCTLAVRALAQDLLGQKLHGHYLEVLDAMEDDDRSVGSEDVAAHLDRALLLDDALEGRAATHRVVHERERLLLGGRAAHLD
eukprot:scaffold1956_cov31-Phaeocystis_antarctica.AAC.1